MVLNFVSVLTTLITLVRVCKFICEKYYKRCFVSGKHFQKWIEVALYIGICITLTEPILHPISTEWILPLQFRCVRAFRNPECIGESTQTNILKKIPYYRSLQL
jgi:hypothetical protein